MKYLTIDQVRAHCKSDSADDEAIEQYADAAEAAFVQMVNRDLFLDADERTVALAALPAAMAAAQTAYDDAMDAAALLDCDARDFAESMACAALTEAKVAASKTIHGTLIDADMIGAMLQLTAHYWANRQSVSVGQGAAAVEVPFATQSIADRRRWNGPL